jgi:hypothetical protein
MRCQALAMHICQRDPLDYGRWYFPIHGEWTHPRRYKLFSAEAFLLEFSSVDHTACARNQGKY